MLSPAVIPCLDVADGRVVKGTRFVDLVDEGDPPELAERYAAEGADELVFLDITRRPRAPRHAPRHRRADRAAGLHPAHRRRRRPDRRRDARRAAGRRRQGLAQHRGRRRPRADRPLRGRGSAGRRSSSRSTRGRPAPGRLGGRRQGRPRGDRPRRRRRGPDAPSSSAPASCWSPRSTATGRGSGFDTALLRAITSRVECPGHRLGRRRRPGRFRRRGPSTAARTPSSPRRSSTAGSTRSPRSRPRWPPPASRSASSRSASRDAADAVRRVRRRRPRAGRRPGRHDGRVLMVACMDAEALAATARDRRGPFPLAVARPAVAQGRDERQRPAPRRAGGRLRRRRVWSPSTRSARPATAGRAAASTRRRARPSGRPRVRLARDAVGDDRRPCRRRGPRARTPRRLLDGGVDAVARKVTEEATEVLLAAKDDAAAEAAGADRAATRPPSRARPPTCCTTRWCCSRSVASPPAAVLDMLRARHRAWRAQRYRAGARSRGGACRSGRRATPRRSAPGRSPAPSRARR